MDLRELALSLVGTALAVAVGASVRAETPAAGPPSIALTWDAPAGCPSGDDLLGEVDRALAGAGTARSSVTGVVHVLPGPDATWEADLTLDIRGTRTERHLQAESCGAIAAAAALIVVMAIEDAPDSPDTAAPGAVATAPVPTVDPGWPASHAVVPAPRIAWPVLKLGGVLDWAARASLPAVGWEVAAGEVWGLGGAWRLHALLTADLFPYLRAPADPELGPIAGHLWQIGLSGRACLETEAMAPFELGPCLGVGAVVLHASDDGGSGDQAGTLANATRFWASALGSLAMAWRISNSTELALHVDLVVPIQRPTFEVAYDPFIHYRVPPFALHGALGVAVRFD